MTILSRRTLITSGAVGTAAIVAGLAVRHSFVSDLAAQQARVSRGSTIFQSRYGQTEYAEAGSGAPVIMIHGTGGGFDQGLAFGRPLLASGYRVIAPSRFGYLRSALPPDASSDAQADVIADLMDHLQIARAPVIGGSAGARSAVAFAIRHPARCSRMIALVPATFVPDQPIPMPGAVGAAIMEYGLRSDFLFWAGIAVAPRRMVRTILATDPALFDAAPPEERARVLAILRSILPVSARAGGLLNDTRLALNPERMAIESIRVPSLAISLEDDYFDTLAAARYLAATAPDIRLISYPTGGHVYIGREAEIFAEIAAFLGRV